MNAIEIILSGASITAAAGGTLYVRHVVRVSGRDRPNDPDLVRQFVRTAPMHRLNHILSK